MAIGTPLPDSVVDALEAFARMALQRMEAQERESGVVPYDSRQRWRPISVDYLSRELVPSVTVVQSRGAGDELTRSPEYEALRLVIEADPWLSRQADQVIGSRTNRFHVSLDRLLDELLEALVVAEPSCRFDRSAFDEAVERLAQLLMPGEVEIFRGVVLTGLSFQGELSLNDGLAVRRLTDGEMAPLLDLGILPGHAQAGMWHVAEKDQLCLCETVLEEKFFGESVESPTGVRDLDDCATRLRSAVRLAVGGATGQGALFEVYRGSVLPVRTSTVGTHASLTVSKRPAELNPASLDRVAELYRQLGLPAMQKDRSLDVPLRRFRDARLRHDATDTLVDLMIAAEGLLVRGQRSELRTTVSLGAAISCELVDAPRSRVHHFMKIAYDARSALVHGNSTKLKLQRLDGQSTDVEGMVDDLERVVQSGLVRAVDQVASTGRVGDWTDQLPALLDSMPPTSTLAPESR